MSVSSGVQECACDAHAKSKHTVECSISCKGFCHQVANLDLPYDAATYMHRVGRTGRFGTHGTAIAFVTPAELQQLRGFLQDVAGGQVRPETNVHGAICGSIVAMLRALSGLILVVLAMQIEPLPAAIPEELHASLVPLHNVPAEATPQPDSQDAPHPGRREVSVAVCTSCICTQESNSVSTIVAWQAQARHTALRLAGTTCRQRQHSWQVLHSITEQPAPLVQAAPLRLLLLSRSRFCGHTAKVRSAAR